LANDPGVLLSGEATSALDPQTTASWHLIKQVQQHLGLTVLLIMREGAGTAAIVRDIVDNPKNLDIRELEAAQLPRALADANLAVMNGNYAGEADLTPSENALVLDAGENNPYANVLAVVSGKETDANSAKLGELLNGEQVQQFIHQQYKGSVVPAF